MTQEKDAAITVTPAMVRAGVAALDAYGDAFVDEIMITEVYAAMAELDPMRNSPLSIKRWKLLIGLHGDGEIVNRLHEFGQELLRDHGSVLLESWEEGLVLRVGGEIVWKSWAS